MMKVKSNKRKCSSVTNVTILVRDVLDQPKTNVKVATKDSKCETILVSLVLDVFLVRSKLTPKMLNVSKMMDPDARLASHVSTRNATDVILLSPVRCAREVPSELLKVLVRTAPKVASNVKIRTPV
jgi:hypothetical protein